MFLRELEYNNRHLYFLPRHLIIKHCRHDPNGLYAAFLYLKAPSVTPETPL